MDQFQDRNIKGYQLVELINRGGFGAVYRATQTLVGREVAFKIILPQYANQPDFVRRFEAEAQVVARLEHFHIVPLYDYWREPEGAYLVMRWLRGGTLRTRLEQHGHLNVETVLKFLDQVAAALTVAHRQGVIHRDIKPDNILLDEDGNAYLADFGIAISLLSGAQFSPNELRLGSPPYMSPEQILGQALSIQTDIYSLGIVLYELLTGYLPFMGVEYEETLRFHLGEPIPPLQKYEPNLSEKLNRVIWRATAKSPLARYETVLHLAQDFRQSISHLLHDAPKTLVTAPVPNLHSVIVSSGAPTVELTRIIEPINPYKGLRPFQEADAADFFGREKLVEHLLGRLGKQEVSSHFMAVIGPSGSGKSSVIRAGLIPKLRTNGITGSKNWFFGQMSPGSHPFRELEGVLLKFATHVPDDLYVDLLKTPQGFLNRLNQILPDDESELLLFIDQFEEVFTLSDDEAEREHFLTSLQIAVEYPASRLRLIIALRADFYDRPLLYPGFGDLLRRYTEVVLPLSPTELAQAIRGPAERSGLILEAELITAIVADISHEPGALPLLQYALTELFEARSGNQLTLAAYNSIGNVSGALARRANEIYEKLDNPGKEVANGLFLRLINIGDGSEVTRRRALQEEILSTGKSPALMLQVMEAFAKFRLLTFDHEPATRAPTVELAHEALIRAWDQLKNWIDASRDDLRAQQRLANASTEWIHAHRDPSFLASGSRLVQFEALATSKNLGLNTDEQAYLAASIEMRGRAAKRTRLVIATLTVFLLVAVLLALFAFERQSKAPEAQSTAVAERDRADVQAQISNSRALAVTALTNLADLDLAVLLSLNALQTADTFEARNSLLTALQYRPHLQQFLHGHRDAVRDVAFSPDGKLIASASWDKTIIVWDAETGKVVLPPLIGHTDGVTSMAFSPDGTLLASSSQDGFVILWDVQTGQPVGEPLQAVADASWSVAFNNDGSLLATGKADGTIELWTLNRNNPTSHLLKGHTDIVYGLAFSPTRNILASSSADQTVQFWDAATGDSMSGALQRHDNWVLSVAFSPDGDYVASTGADRQIWLWDAATSQPIGSFMTDHTDWVTSITFSPDGTELVTASNDHQIKRWDAVTGEALGSLVGHTDKVWSAGFSPDGHTIASAAGDATVIVWDVTPHHETMGKELDGYSPAISSVVFSPDGTLLASADGDLEMAQPAIRLWDTATGQLKSLLTGHLGPITSLTFSPNGTIIASASADQSVILWDVATGNPIGEPMLGHTNAVFGVAFDPSGKILASGSDDGTVILWDVASASPIGRPLTSNMDNAGVHTVAFSPDGSLLASAGQDNRIHLWDVAQHTLIGTPLVGHTDWVTRLTFSPNGTLLASGSRDSSIILWDVAKQQMSGQPLIGHSNYVNDIAFSPDGRQLISGGGDNRVILWDVALRRPLGVPFTGHSDWVTAVAFSPGGNLMASGSLDTTLTLWDASLESWKRRGCRLANRSLSPQEIDYYNIGSIPQGVCLDS
jgi:WD40 repeat protein/serine/threonine protein kinase